MIENVFIGIGCIALLAAGVLSWWIDNGGTFKREKKEAEKDLDNHEK